MNTQMNAQVGVSQNGQNVAMAQNQGQIANQNIVQPNQQIQNNGGNQMQNNQNHGGNHMPNNQNNGGNQMPNNQNNGGNQMAKN